MGGTQLILVNSEVSFGTNSPRECLYSSTSAHLAACSQVFKMDETLELLFLRSDHQNIPKMWIYAVSLRLLFVWSKEEKEAEAAKPSIHKHNQKPYFLLVRNELWYNYTSPSSVLWGETEMTRNREKQKEPPFIKFILLHKFTLKLYFKATESITKDQNIWISFCIWFSS